MLRRFEIPLVLIVTLSIAHVLAAASTRNPKPERNPHSQTPSAIQIVERFIKAVGGREAWTRIRSQYGTGTLEAPTSDDKGTFEVFAKAPNRGLVVLRLTHAGEIRAGFDGQRGWNQTPRGGVQIAPVAMHAALKRDADLYKYLHFNEHFPSAKSIGVEDVEGNPAYVVEANPAGGDLAERLYFDVRSGLLVRRDTFGEGGEPKKTPDIMHYTDYREVGGIKVAFSVRTTQESGTSIFKYVEVKNNLTIEDKVFDMPLQGSPERTHSIAPDRSLTSEGYIQKGLPAHDRDWSGSDYSQAASILKTLSATDASLLPRYNSPTSGVMFARFVSLENFRLFRSEALSLQQQFGTAASTLQGVAQIMSVYGSASTPQSLFDSEVVELLRCTLQVSQDVARLAEAFFASLPANDPSRDARLKGREQISQGLASIVSGCLTTLTEKGAYRLSELFRLAETLEMILPEMMTFLPPGTQQEIPARLKRMIQQEIDPSLKERLTRISMALSKARSARQ